ncbi:MarR family winged helix-turn-helix transcriptional regulator [Parvibaculum sp.]|uniref:MarR family winged helix-turn-helix transcriptional regulator n=1 Tax=Parvibaculum sp. TaxID=2024848 RepID=UPI0027308568|nr:MarR family transcriptional regulator [Parvibaculum sp.]MDP1627559.1 MarR family transcriptional regulator [Parvibaculum sp.]MDP2148738.1 MarR family transcriptional regulator [Parvibaculum sp.]MDP3329954.1 MarR family transcriptional regulator [Parvibaculum sp.]
MTGKDRKAMPDREFGWLHRDVFRLFKRAWETRLRASGTGITVPQSRVFAELRQQDGVTQTELADLVMMEKAPLGRLLDRMEELRLIERRPDPADRRVRRVYLTDAIDGFHDELWDAAFGMFDDALKGFTAEEYETLVAMLRRIKENLEAVERNTPHEERTGRAEA